MSSCYTPKVHGKYVAHWTGKDISTNVKDLNENSRQKYVDRIFKTLETGLWMTAPKEKLFGYSNNDKIDYNPIEYKMPFTSFTEIKANNIHIHAIKYGMLGFVFDKSFIKERDGGPVFYVQYRDWKTTNLSIVNNFLNEVASSTLPVIINGREIEKKKLELYHNFANTLVYQFKSMASSPDEEYDNYEECEWRIPYIYRTEGKYLVKGNWQNSDKEPQFYIPFKISDLQLLVVPDLKIKKMLLADSRWKKNFNLLNILTIEEYGNI